jgi:hypothetical protein
MAQSQTPTRRPSGTWTRCREAPPVFPMRRMLGEYSAEQLHNGEPHLGAARSWFESFQNRHNECLAHAVTGHG